MDIDLTFEYFIEDLMNYATDKADGLVLEVDKTKWLHFTQEEPGIDVTDVPLLGKAFSRSEPDGINDKYIEKLGNGTFAELMALDQQGNYMAAMERSFRFRYSGKIRRRAHCAARYYGHGEYDVGLFDRVYYQILTTLESGDSTDNLYTEVDSLDYDEMLMYLEEEVNMELENAGRLEEDTEDSVNQM